MNVESTQVPAHERGAGDHDEPYTWCLSPSMYLAPRQIARMMVFRSRLDNRHTLRNRANRPPPRPGNDQ